jgi:hypothetical protein
VPERLRWTVLAPSSEGGRLTFPLDGCAVDTTLWFEVAPRDASLLSERVDAAALALLLPAMAAGADLHVEGAISARLLHHLQGPLQVLTRLRLPSLRRITVTAERVASPPAPAVGVGIGFSGGVDSWHALWRHSPPQAPAGMAVTHLTFHDVGAHDGSEALFAARRERVERIAASVGLPLVVVRSNMDDFYAPHPALSFVYTDAIRNVAVAHALSGGIGRFLYASATDYRMIGAAWPWSSNTEQVAIPMFASEGLDPVSVGGDVPRPAKLAILADAPVTYATLDVCTRRGWLGEGIINCSRCGKCARTMATLDVLGFLPRYAAVFDLAVYQRDRTRTWAGLLVSPLPLVKEVVVLARQRGYRIPPAAFVQARLRWPYLRRLIRRARTRSRGCGAMG